MEKISLKEGVDLQEHQKRVMEKLQHTNAILLYHGLGSGKTLSSIAATEGMSTDVVTPASLRTNYKKELKKFNGSSKGYNVVSYDGASSGKLDGTGAKALVVDEIHRIANKGSARSKAIMELSKGYDKKIALTGTPIVNHPSDIAPIIKFLDPNNKTIPLDRAEFNKRFIKKKKQFPGLIGMIRGVKPGTVDKLVHKDEIAKALRGRVDYQETGSENYPDVVQETVKVPMSKSQYGIYKAVSNQANPILAYKVRKNLSLTKKEMSSMNSFASAVRQTSNSSARYGGEEGSPKLDQVVNDFNEVYKKHPKFKGLVYSNYIGSGLDVIKSKFDKAGVKSVRFTGDMKEDDRIKAVKDYNEGRVNALLISSAGAEGLDLKGTGMVQVVEPHWNKSKIDQVVGRAARYGSHAHLAPEKRKVTVKRYESVLPRGFLGIKRGDSIDEYLNSMSAKKDKLNQSMLDIIKHEGSRNS